MNDHLLSDAYHQLSKKTRDPDTPGEVLGVVENKSYPRFPVVSLGDKNSNNIVYTPKEIPKYKGASVTKLEISTLLFNACGVVKSTKTEYQRMYPSVGNCYPVEIYPIVLSKDGEVEQGLYHYNLKHHLETLWKRSFSKQEQYELFSDKFLDGVSVALVLTASLLKHKSLHGERGYRYTLLEVGHVVQNIYKTSAELGLGFSVLENSNDKALETLLDIDGITESVVSCVLVGK